METLALEAIAAIWIGCLAPVFAHIAWRVGRHLCRGRQVVKIWFAVSHIDSDSGETPMTTFVPTDAPIAVPLEAVDQLGRKIAVPVGGTLTAEPAGIVNASLSADGQSVILTSAGIGGASVTYSNGPLSAGLSVTVGAAVAESVKFDEAKAALVAAAPVAQDSAA